MKSDAQTRTDLTPVYSYQNLYLLKKLTDD